MPAASSDRMVGREGELARISDAVQCARGGRLASVVVEGEPGIGKTRLVAEAIEQYASSSDVVITGRAVEVGGSGLELGLVCDAFRDLALIRRPNASDVKRAARSADGVLERLNSARELAGEMVDVGFACRSLVDVIEGLGARRLVWLRLEDVQWIDPTSADVLTYLARLARPSMLICLLTMRRVHSPAGHVRRLLSELSLCTMMDRFELLDLDDAEIGRLVSVLTGDHSNPEVITRVAALSGGNPLLVGALLASGSDLDTSVPLSLRDLMVPRLLRLPSDSAALVRTASATLMPFEPEMLSRVVDASPDDVMQMLDSAVVESIVDVRGARYGFHHELLRQAVYTELSEVERRGLNARWAAAYAADPAFGERTDLQVWRGHHLEAAGDFDAAFELALEMGDRHRRDEDIGAAPSRQRVLRLWPKVRDADVRAGCSREEYFDKSIEWFSGDPEVLRLVQDEVVHAASDDRVRSVCLQVYDASAQVSGGAQGQGGVPRRELEALLPRLLSAPARTCVVNALFHLSWLLMHRSPDAARQAIDRLVDLGHESGDVQVSWLGRSQHAFHLAAVGRAELGVAEFDDILREMAEAGDDRVWLTIANRADLLLALGRFDEARTRLRWVLDQLPAAEQMPLTWKYVAEHLLDTLIVTGDWDELDALMARTLRLSPSLDRAVGLYRVCGGLACFRGEVASAQRWQMLVEGLIAGDDERAFGPFVVERRWLAAEVALVAEGPVAAWAKLEPLWNLDWLSSVSDLSWRPVVLGASILGEIGRSHRAIDGSARRPELADHLHAMRTVVEQHPKQGELGAVWEASVLADLDRASGGVDPDRWTSVADAWASIEARPNRSAALIKAGQDLLAVGKRAEARSVLEDARSLADDLKAKPMIDEIKRTCRRGGLDLRVRATADPSAEKRPPPPLTGREMEVLALIARGRSDRQIARALGITPRTTGVHVSHILGKLQVSSRTEAAVVALEAGLVDASPTVP